MYKSKEHAGGGGRYRAVENLIDDTTTIVIVCPLPMRALWYNWRIRTAQRLQRSLHLKVIVCAPHRVARELEHLQSNLPLAVYVDELYPDQRMKALVDIRNAVSRFTSIRVQVHESNLPVLSPVVGVAPLFKPGVLIP